MTLTETEAPFSEWDKWYTCLELAAKHKKKRAYYEALLAAGVSFDNDTPLLGYWRVQSWKNGPIEPLGVWMAHGKLVVEHAGKDITDYSRVWPRAMLSPISHEWYKDYPVNGWPDLDSGVAALLSDDYTPEGWRELPDAPPPMGDNKPPAPDLETLAGIKDAIAFLMPEVAKYRKITSDTMRDAAQSLASKFAELRLKADKMRKALVDPHVAAQRKINGEYSPVIEEAEALAESLKAAQKAWANEKYQAEQKKAREEAAAQRAAEEAARAANRPPPPPPPPAPPPPTVTEFRGALGRMKKEVLVTVLDENAPIDWMRLFAYYQNHIDVRQLLWTLACRDLRDTGVIPPGVSTKEEVMIK